MKNGTFAAVLVSLVLGLSPALAQDTDMDKRIDTVLGDHTKYVTVISALQKAVKAPDPAAVASLVSYPIKVTLGGKAKSYKTKKAFIASYKQIMTPAIANAVVNQKYADLIVNSQGVGFGSGQVWINGICKDTACKNPVGALIM